jgi:hypothetical protein
MLLSLQVTFRTRGMYEQPAEPTSVTDQPLITAMLMGFSRFPAQCRSEESL